jgi:hypothetical protein
MNVLLVWNRCSKSGEYEPKESDDESTLNMAARYSDIEKAFPEEIKNSVLPFFIDWLKYNVVSGRNYCLLR